MTHFIDRTLRAEEDYFGLEMLRAEIRIHYTFQPATRDCWDEPGSCAYVEFHSAERIDCHPAVPIVSGPMLEWAKKLLDAEESSAIEAAEDARMGDPDARRDAMLERAA
jgi:hypothetical protein